MSMPRSSGLSPLTKTPVAMPTASHARKNAVPMPTAAAVLPGARHAASRQRASIAATPAALRRIAARYVPGTSHPHGLGDRTRRAISAEALDDELRRDQAHRQPDARKRRGARIRETVDLAGGVARPEDRALAESVREAEGIAAPGMEVGREVARGDGAAQDDPVGEIRDVAPRRDLRDDAIRGRLDLRVAVAVDPAAA